MAPPARGQAGQPTTARARPRPRARARTTPPHTPPSRSGTAPPAERSSSRPMSRLLAGRCRPRRPVAPIARSARRRLPGCSRSGRSRVEPGCRALHVRGAAPSMSAPTEWVRLSSRERATPARGTLSMLDLPPGRVNGPTGWSGRSGAGGCALPGAGGCAGAGAGALSTAAGPRDARALLGPRLALAGGGRRRRAPGSRRPPLTPAPYWARGCYWQGVPDIVETVAHAGRH